MVYLRVWEASHEAGRRCWRGRPAIVCPAGSAHPEAGPKRRVGTRSSRPVDNYPQPGIWTRASDLWQGYAPPRAGGVADPRTRARLLRHEDPGRRQRIGVAHIVLSQTRAVLARAGSLLSRSFDDDECEPDAADK